MKTLILVILLSASVSNAKGLTLNQVMSKVGNIKNLTLDKLTSKVTTVAEAAGEYELDASEVCDFFKNELTNKQKQECKALESESNNESF